MNNQGSKFDNGIQIPYDKLWYINSSGTVVQFDFESFDLPGTLDVTGAVTLDSTLDVAGASQFDSTVTVGEDDTGYDVKFFGATSGEYFLWDESEDKFGLGGRSGRHRGFCRKSDFFCQNPLGVF